MVQYHGIGLLTPGVGLFHTVFSQADRIQISILADRDTMPDPSFYIECLRASYAELLKAVGKPASAKTAKKSETPAIKVAAKKATAKKTPTKKAAVKKTPTKKAAAKAAKKVPAKKAAAKKAPAKKPSASKAATKKTPALKAAPLSEAVAKPRARRKPGAVAPKLKVV